MTMIQLLGEWVVRSSILILAGVLLLWLLRIKNPSVRLTAWTAMLVGSLAIPLLTAAVPKLPLRVMRPHSLPAAPPALTGEPDFASQTALVNSIPTPTSLLNVPKPFDGMRFAAVLYS